MKDLPVRRQSIHIPNSRRNFSSLVVFNKLDKSGVSTGRLSISVWFVSLGSFARDIWRC